ncbi:pkaR, partial [Symbiodinium sp. KB8]
LVDLDRTRINAIIDVAWKQEVPKGTRLITEGDLNADYFYIVQSGLFSISIADQKDGTALGSIGPGGSFGELALIYFAPRAATVEATEKATVWVIDRGNFKKILAKSADELEGEYLKLLDKVELLSPLKKDEKAALARSMTEVSFVKGELIFKQGAEGDAFYLLVDGTVDVIKDGKPKTRLKGTREKAAYFGERALLQKEPRAATLKVYSVKAKALMLDKQSFEMLLGPLEELQRRPKGGKSKLQEQPGSALLRKSRFGKIKRKDLKVLGLLGCGGFGAVELVEHEKTGNTYALKDFKDAAALKEHLWELCGCFPLYLQQLLHDGNVLGDGAELDASMDLQLVLLTISDGMFSVSQEPIWQMLLEETLIKWSVVCSKLVLIKISALTARQR